jgi:hypothetical protein
MLSIMAAAMSVWLLLTASLPLPDWQCAGVVVCGSLGEGAEAQIYSPRHAGWNGLPERLRLQQESVCWVVELGLVD